MGIAHCVKHTWYKQHYQLIIGRIKQLEREGDHTSPHSTVDTRYTAVVGEELKHPRKSENNMWNKTQPSWGTFSYPWYIRFRGVNEGPFRILYAFMGQEDI
jgi:hypothetical protein